MLVFLGLVMSEVFEEEFWIFGLIICVENCICELVVIVLGIFCSLIWVGELFILKEVM